jgi:hypothetical protein
MFFITNIEAVINLENCTFIYGSGVIWDAEGTSEWGLQALMNELLLWN